MHFSSVAATFLFLFAFLPLLSAVEYCATGVDEDFPPWSAPSFAWITAVGENGTIMHSQDGGASWCMQRQTVTTATLRKISFLDAINIAIAGDDSTMILSEDAGHNWNTFSMTNLSTTADVMTLDFPRSGMVFGAAYENGSSTMLQCDTQKLTCQIMSNLDSTAVLNLLFVGPTVGFAVGTVDNCPTCLPSRYGVSLATVDAGATWLTGLNNTKLSSSSSSTSSTPPIPVSFSLSAMAPVFTTTSFKIAMGGGNGSIVFAAPSGLSWEWTELDIPYAIDVVSLDSRSSVLFALGSTGEVLKLDINAGTNAKWTILCGPNCLPSSENPRELFMLGVDSGLVLCEHRIYRFLIPASATIPGLFWEVVANSTTSLMSFAGKLPSDVQNSGAMLTPFLTNVVGVVMLISLWLGVVC